MSPIRGAFFCCLLAQGHHSHLHGLLPGHVVFGSKGAVAHTVDDIVHRTANPVAFFVPLPELDRQGDQAGTNTGPNDVQHGDHGLDHHCIDEAKKADLRYLYEQAIEHENDLKSSIAMYEGDIAYLSKDIAKMETAWDYYKNFDAYVAEFDELLATYNEAQAKAWESKIEAWYAY